MARCFEISVFSVFCFFFFKQKTAYEMCGRDWSSDVCSSDLMKLHYGDLTDSTCLVKLISQIQPDEIYNLGAMSHVKVATCCIMSPDIPTCNH